MSQPITQDGYSRAAGVETSSVSQPVMTNGQSADDDYSVPSQLAGDSGVDCSAIAGRLATTDDGDGRCEWWNTTDVPQLLSRLVNDSRPLEKIIVMREYLLDVIHYPAKVVDNHDKAC